MADKQHHAAQPTNGEAEPVIGPATGRIGSGLAPLPDVVDEEPTRKKATALLILVLVVGGAIGGVFAMRALTGAPAKDPPDNLPDPEVFKRKADQIKGEIDKAVGDLRTDYTKGQVKGVKNPFEGETKPPPPPPPPGPTKFEKGAELLDLGALMGGGVPVAVINGKPRVAGDVIVVDLALGEGTVNFRVKKITKEFAIVEAEGAIPPFEKTLTMRRRR